MENMYFRGLPVKIINWGSYGNVYYFDNIKVYGMTEDTWKLVLKKREELSRPASMQSQAEINRMIMG